jgi:hypothetical protein
VSIRVFDDHAPEEVFAFLEYAVSARGRAHWRWKYRTEAADSPSAFYWQEPDGRVLGFIGMMRTALHAGPQRHPAAWFVDWHVTPGQRGVGVGLGLLRKAEAAAGVLLTLQGSADTRQILPRLGWKQSLAPATWVLPLTARFISDWVGRRALAQAAPWLRGTARVFGIVAGPYFRRGPAPSLPDAALAVVDRFPADYDTVWAARAVEFAPAMSRDSTYVNYLCADYPGGGYRLELLRWKGETAGHLIWRTDADGRGFQRGRIVDVLWPRAQPELLAWLVHSACWQLQQAGADYVECVASVPDLRAALQRRRFRPRGPLPLWYHRLPAGVPEPDRWHITFLDCDRAYR